MAAFNWEVYTSTWSDAGSNTLVFCGSATDLTTPITINTWNTGFHLGSGDPGTDQCGGTHAKYVTWVSSTQFNNGSGTQTLSTTNLLETECNLRIKFTDAASVATTNAKFYCYNSTDTATRASGLEVQAVEWLTAGITTWTEINDDSDTIGGTANALSLANQSANTTHYFVLAVSAMPETVGAKTAFDFGVSLTYS